MRADKEKRITEEQRYELMKVACSSCPVHEGVYCKFVHNQRGYREIPVEIRNHSGYPEWCMRRKTILRGE